MPLVLAGLALAVVTMLLFGNTELDRSLLILLHLEAGAPLAGWAAVANEAAQASVLLALAGAGAGFLLYRREWRRALLLVAIVIGGFLLVELIGAVSVDLRPNANELLYEGQQLRFPDPGLATLSLTLLGLAFLLTRRAPWRDGAVFAAALIAFSIGVARLLLGAAWPTDVIAAWALALFWTLLLLRSAGEDVGEGTPRPLRHSSGEERIMDNQRTEAARRNDDSDLIEDKEDAPAFDLTSGGTLQRDIGSRAEMQNDELSEPGVARVRDQDKPEGANLPRFNEK